MFSTRRLLKACRSGAKCASTLRAANGAVHAFTAEWVSRYTCLMHQSRRTSYLRALDIDVWEPRARREARPEASAAPEPVRPAGSGPGWEALRAEVRDCRKCPLCETRTQTVFGVGPPQAALMVVGEGPGADEDAQGQPFVGRAGKLLDQMLKAIGRSRDTDTYIANVVKCRPPGNREPAEGEAEACRAYLEGQLRLVRPRLILALGRVAAQRLLGSAEPLARLRGPLHHWGPDATPLMVTYHPAYLLRSPGEKAKSWEDLKKVRQFLQP